MVRRSDVGRVLAAAVLLAAAGPALAHGEQVALLPVGQLVALVVVMVLALRVKIDQTWRVVAVLLPVLVSLPPWFVTNEYLPYWVSFSALAWFVLGLVPPIAVSGLLLLWRRRSRQRGAPAVP